MLCVNPTGNILKWYKAFFKLRLIILARVLSVKKGLRLRRILATWAQMPLQSHFLPLSSALCSILGVSDFPVVSGCYIFNYDLTLGGVHGFLCVRNVCTGPFGVSRSCWRREGGVSTHSERERISTKCWERVRDSLTELTDVCTVSVDIEMRFWLSSDYLRCDQITSAFLLTLDGIQEATFYNPIVLGPRVQTDTILYHKSFVQPRGLDWVWDIYLPTEPEHQISHFPHDYIL